MSDIKELDSKIDTVEWDCELKFDEIEDQIKKIKSDMNIWRVFSKYTIPYSYEGEMSIIQKKLECVDFSKYLNKYLEISNMKNDIPKLYNLEKKEYLKKIIYKNSTNLKNSKIFLELGQRLYWDIKPILYYYSISYLLSSFIGFFFDFKNSKSHHGLGISNVGKDPYKINIKFQKSGLFQRIVKAFSYIFDYSMFTDYFIIPKSKLCDTTEYINFKNESIFSINSKSISLGDLIKNIKRKKIIDFYDKLVFNEDYRPHHSKNFFIENSMLLKEYILIFVACNLARYNHYAWKNIYEGEKTDIFLHFQTAINSFGEKLIYLSNRFEKYDNVIRYF